jgi:signal peptidase I
VTGAADTGQAVTEGDARGSGQLPAGRTRRSWLTEFIILVVVALAVALGIKTYLLQPFVIPSGSMENTLLIGDKVLVNKLVGHLSQIHRGDIVVFNGTGSWKPPAPTDSNPLARIYHDVLGLVGNDAGQTDYIKRVVGLPGDHVRCCNAGGLLTVNGIPLHESSYLYPGSAPSTVKFSIVVPPGRLWVMGDNRDESADSRSHDCQIPGANCQPWDRDGTIPENKVIGRAFLVIWPPSRFKVLWVPAAFSQPGLTALHSSAGSHSAASTVAASAALTTGQLRAIPADPALPLAAGGIIAVPLTLLERRWRLLARRRRLTARAATAAHQPNTPSTARWRPNR